MSDVEYVEGMMNYDMNDNTQLNNFNFAVGDIVVDVDKNSSVFEEINSQSFIDNSSVLNENDVFKEVNTFNESSFVETANEFNEKNSVDNSVVQIDHPALRAPLHGGELQVENLQSFISEENVIENESNFIEEMNEINNSSVFNESNNHVNNSVANNSTKNPVTVNLNNYNEFHSSGRIDTDSVLSAFGEKLKAAVSLAAEGLHL